jgi:hypothetical protein
VAKAYKSKGSMPQHYRKHALKMRLHHKILNYEPYLSMASHIICGNGMQKIFFDPQLQ